MSIRKFSFHQKCSARLWDALEAAGVERLLPVRQPPEWLPFALILGGMILASAVTAIHAKAGSLSLFSADGMPAVGVLTGVLLVLYGIGMLSVVHLDRRF